MSQVGTRDALIAKLERQREVLLNAIVEAVRIITGSMPDSREIRQRFLDEGTLPKLHETGMDRDEYPMREASFK